MKTLVTIGDDTFSVEWRCGPDPEDDEMDIDDYYDGSGNVQRDAQGVYRGSGPAPQAQTYNYAQPTSYSSGPAATDWSSLYSGASPSTSTAMAPVSGGSRVYNTGAAPSAGGGVAAYYPVASKNRDAVQTPSQAVGPGPGAYSPEAIPDEFFKRLQAILQNPGDIASDPAFQFIMQQGTKALGRSAGANRMRFSGKSMTDFQDFGQRAASQYYGQIADQNRQAAGAELDRWSAKTNAGFTESGQNMNEWQARLGSETATFNTRLADALARDQGAAQYRGFSPSAQLIDRFPSYDDYQNQFLRSGVQAPVTQQNWQKMLQEYKQFT